MPTVNWGDACECLSYRLLNSSFFLVQSIGGALLLERFWCASSFTCCRDRLSAGMASAMKPWMKKKSNAYIVSFKGRNPQRMSRRGTFPEVTSGGVSVGWAMSEVLDEVLDGEGLTDSLESLAASLAPRPFTWEHKHSASASPSLPHCVVGGAVPARTTGRRPWFFLFFYL